MTHKIYFDGGTALNAICIVDEDRDIHLVERIHEHRTNNELEYMALLKGVIYANAYYGDSRNIVFLGDSELIVKQMKGINKVKKPHLKHLQLKVRNAFIVASGRSYIDSNFEWVPRNKNKAGVILENMLNTRRNVG